MADFSHPRPLARAVRAALFSLSLPLAALPGVALAAPASQHYQIPAGPLDGALNAFARQAGVLLSFDPALTAGRSSQGLSGEFQAQQGFAVLLAGSGLRAVGAVDGSYRLEPAPDQGALQLQSLNVIAELDSPIGEDSGYLARNSRSATKTNTPLHETPRSVTVVTEEQLRDRNALSISDALKYSPGIQAGYFGEDNKQDWFIIRGFKQANNGLFQDGVRVFSSGFYSWQIDPYMLERVEVLKGASSVLYGQTTPGGVINLQSKRPSAAQQSEVGVQYGSFDRKQLNLDVGGKLNEEGSLLYRVVALSRDTGTQVDDVDAERLLLAPSLTIDFNEATSLTLLSSFQKDNSDPQLQFLPAEGSLISSPNGEIDTDTAIGNPGFEKFDRTQFNVGYELNHRINDSWDFQQNLRYGHLDVDLRQAYYSAHSVDYFNSVVTGLVRQGIPQAMALGLANARIGDLNDPSRQSIMRGLTYTDGQADNFSLDNRLLNYWSGDGLESTFLAGVDYQRLAIDEESFAADPWIRQPLNVYNPSYPSGVSLFNPTTLAPVTAANLQDKRTRADQLGLYLQEQLKVDERWVFLLGGRYDKARSDVDNRTTGVHKNIRDEEFTWTAGSVYLFDNGLAPYASYSEFFLPVADINTSTGEPFEPERGNQKEVGLKYQPVGLDASFNLALFELTQENVRKNTAAGVRTQIGEVRSRGVELEAVADLTENFSLVGSLTFLDPETTKTTVAAEKGKRPSQVSDRLASLWASYDFKGGPLDGFAIGAGARYTGDSYGDNRETDSLRVPSYTLYDAMASYTWENLKLQVNANNLTDKEYIATCDFYCWYGNRRNVITSVSYAW